MRWLVLMILLTAGQALAAAEPLDPAGAPAPVRRAVFRAELAHGRGDVDEAVTILQSCLDGSEDRSHPALRYRLGAYLLEQDRTDDALPHLQAAAELAPGAPPVWADLARATYETGRYARAARAFAQAHAAMDAEYHDGHDDHDPPDPSLLYYAGVSWILAEHPAEAVDVLAPLAAAVNDTVPVAWVQALVSAATELDQPERATAGVARLLRDHPSSRPAWLLASQQSQITGDVAEAALRLQVAHWLLPLGARDRKHLADLYGAAQLPRLAARNYAALWPDDPSLTRPLAVSWLQAHEPDSARVVLTTALDSDVGDAELWSLLGDLEYEVERWDAAREAYARATELDAARGRAWLMQGACSVKLADHGAAREALERARRQDGVAAEAERLLGYVGALE